VIFRQLSCQHTDANALRGNLLSLLCYTNYTFVIFVTKVFPLCADNIFMMKKMAQRKTNKLNREKELNMKRIFIAAVVMFFGLWVGNVFAAANDTATVNYSVSAINEVAIDDASETFAISTATAGAQPDNDTDSGAYDITTNCAANAKKLTAALDLAMPTGTTLVMNVTAPTGGTSANDVTLTAVAQNVVTAIDGVAEANIVISYTFTATVAAGVVTNTPKTLTLTLADT
jgi:hypothetical protein